jgi:hypothetical protein
VINGTCTVEFPQRNNISIIYRENTGFDFQGYYRGLLSLKDKQLLRPNDYYIFMNCTVRGPFLPPYTTRHIYWYTPYIDLLTGNVKLVGSTINGYISPHVQTYIFVMDYEGVNFLLTKNFFKLCTHRDEVITQQEIALSQIILSNGWNMDCLVPEYKNLDYVNKKNPIKSDDIRFAKNIIGRDLSPYEVIFIKSEWGDPTNQLASLTNVGLIGPESGACKFTCQKVTYGISEKNSRDVTQVIRQLKHVDTNQLQPNTVFGDPYPEQSKNIYIYVDKQAKPFVLRELENHIREHDFHYILDFKPDIFLCHQIPVYNK